MIVFHGLPLRTAKEFYVNNIESLFKGHGRPLWLSILMILLEHFILFSLMLTKPFLKEYQNQDESLQDLHWVSIHEISLQDSKKIVVLIFGFNIGIILMFIGFFIFFCFHNFKQKKSFLSSLIFMNYNTTLVIPSVLLSLQSINGISISNMTLTLILSIYLSVHSTKFYSLNVSDYLAKRGNLWDYLRCLF